VYVSVVRRIRHFYNCLFAGNTADYGGGINFPRFYSDGIAGKLVNCVLTGNAARATGGACYLYGPGTLLLTNCTLSANSAPEARSLYVDSHNHDYPSTVTIANSILWNDGDEIVIADGSTVDISYSDVFDGWPGTGNIDALPQFADIDGADDILGTPMTICDWRPDHSASMRATAPPFRRTFRISTETRTITEPLPYDFEGHDRIVNADVLCRHGRAGRLRKRRRHGRVRMSRRHAGAGYSAGRHERQRHL
jgi:hypothetical protein